MDDETRQIIGQRFDVEVRRLGRQFEADVADLRESFGQWGLTLSTGLVYETLKLEAKRFGALLDAFLTLHLEYVQDGDELASLNLESTFGQMFESAVSGAMMRIPARHRNLFGDEFNERVRQPLLEALATAQVRLRTEIHRMKRAQASALATASQQAGELGGPPEPGGRSQGHDEVLLLKPNYLGIGIDLRALGRKIRQRFWPT